MKHELHIIIMRNYASQVMCNPGLSFALFEAVGTVKFFQRGERAANDFLCCLCDPLELFHSAT